VIVTAVMLAVLRRGLSLRFWCACQVFMALLNVHFLTLLQRVLCGLFAATLPPE
jgi:hypothetical protein